MSYAQIEASSLFPLCDRLIGELESVTLRDDEDPETLAYFHASLRTLKGLRFLSDQGPKDHVVKVSSDDAGLIANLLEV